MFGRHVFLECACALMHDANFWPCKALMTVIKRFLRKTCLAGFIWQRLDLQDETVERI